MATLFSAQSPDYYEGLWITDGTTSGTRLIQPAGLGNTFLDVMATASMGKQMLFTAWTMDGLGLWRSDGTDSGTTLITIMTSGIAIAGPFVQAGNKWFTTVTKDGVRELWITDGTSAGTKFLTGLDRSITLADQIVEAGGGKYVFAKTDATGDRELWVTDGTAAGTGLLKNIDDSFYTGTTEPISSSPRGFITLGGKALFGVFETNGGLYKTDGTGAGTTHVAFDQALGSPTYTVSFGGEVVFSSRSTGNNAYQLWKTDGTAAGTELIKNFGDDPDMVFINDFKPTAAGLFFNVQDDSTSEDHTGLWITDGTTAGTLRLASAGGLDFTPVTGGKYVYMSERQLWVTDGTETETEQIGALTITLGLPTFAALGGKAYFAADDGASGVELWVTDGTQAGTHLVKDINPTGNATPALFHVAGDKIYFQATDGSTGAEVWVSDGTSAGTHILKDINTTGTTNSWPQFFFQINIAPSDIAISSSTVKEITLVGGVIGTLTATDFDLSDTHTFTLRNNAGGRFAIDGDKLVIADRMGFDYELKTSHSITVRATDQGGKFVDKTFTIAVNDIATETVYGDLRANKISGGANADELSGGGGNDTIWGGGGKDRLYGGEGADSLFGGVGDDELSGGADDDALWGGGDNDRLNGGNGADTLFGGEGEDRLDGGAGADSLSGGSGSDLYWITSGDTISETAGSGAKDRVHASDMSLDLRTLGGGFIEQAVLKGDLALNLTGNAVANALWGNAGANVVNGKAGSDYLTGGAGNDTFAFDTRLGAQNVDRIVDFAKGDRIALDNAIFGKIGAAGALKSAFFQAGKADDKDDFILYDKATGALFYDADGNGAGAAVKFAVVDTKPTLSAGDFLVI